MRDCLLWLFILEATLPFLFLVGQAPTALSSTGDSNSKADTLCPCLAGLGADCAAFRTADSNSEGHVQPCGGLCQVKSQPAV